MYFGRYKTSWFVVGIVALSGNALATNITVDASGNPSIPVPYYAAIGETVNITPSGSNVPTLTSNGSQGTIVGGNVNITNVIVTDSYGPLAAPIYGRDQNDGNMPPTYYENIITVNSQGSIRSYGSNPTNPAVLINFGSITLSGAATIFGEIQFDRDGGANPIYLDLSASSGVSSAITGNIVGAAAKGNALANLQATVGATNITGNITTINTGTLNFDGPGSVIGNLDTTGAMAITINGSGTVNGTMSMGSGSSLAVVYNNATMGAISGLSTLSVTSGSGATYTINNTVGVANTLTIGSVSDPHSALNVNAAMSGAANINNYGIITVNSAGSLPTGAVTNSGQIVVNYANLTFANGIVNTGGVSVNNGSITLSSALSGSSGFVNIGGTLNLSTGASIGSNQPITLYGSGTMSINGNATVASTITGQVAGSINTSTLNFGNLSPATFSTAAALVNVANINIYSGSALTLANPASGVTTFINSGTANINNTLSGSSMVITNAGTMVVNNPISTVASINNSGTFDLKSSLTGVGTSTITSSGAFTLDTGSSLSGFSTIYLSSGGALNIPITYSLSGITITGTTAPTETGDINISAAAVITVNTPISYLNSINLAGTSSLTTTAAISNINSVSIGSGTLFTLSGQASVSSFNDLIVNGTFQINSGASFTLSANQNISGTGSGLIKNYGQLLLNNSSVTFPGSFTNYNTATFTIDGQPTLNFTGSVFSNQGNIIANFSTTNSLPLITTSAVTPDLSTGTFIIGYNNNYIASGNYPVLDAPNSVTTINPGSYILPQPSFYISSWSLSSTTTSVDVTVVRDGFDQHALTPSTVQIGAYLEQLGSTTNSPAILNLLNALEKITNDAQLTLALESLLPPQYTMLVTLEMLDYTLGALDMRIASLRRGYGSGDVIPEDKNSAWIRPFSTYGKQSANGTLQGYTDKNHGYVFGIDRTLNNNLTLGVAGTVSKTFVQDTITSGSTTNINNYEVMFYGTLRSYNDAYLDAIICAGNSNYHGIRVIAFPGYQAVASSNYSSQQLTLKAMASKIFALNDFWQLTPMAMAQYSFIRQLPYTETGAGAYDVYNDPDNINLFRLGTGVDLGVPFVTRNITSLPSVYMMFYVDAKGGANTTNTMFVGGGPFLTNSVQASRLMLKLGACYELKFNQNFEMAANYDYVVRHGFKGHEAFLNLRYIF